MPGDHAFARMECEALEAETIPKRAPVSMLST